MKQQGVFNFNVFCKIHRNKIFIFIAVVLLFLPFFWSEHIEFDCARFTEEWYKSILVYLGVGILIIFYTDKNKEIKKDELLNKRNQKISKIIETGASYEDIVSNINDFIELTKYIHKLYNDEYLNDKEKFAKSEMEYYIKYSNKNNYLEHSNTFENIKLKLS